MGNEMFYVDFKVVEEIATIQFYHPKGNSFPTAQLKSLQKILKELGENSKIKVVVLQSEGQQIFSAGASFDELVKLKDTASAKEFFMGFAKVLIALKECPKFIIAAVEGKAVGGGLGLIAGCDYAIALQNAEVKLSELSIGIGPFVIEPAIRRKIGLVAVSELALHPNRWCSAEWCRQQGLYNEVFATHKEFSEGIQEFAHSLSQYSADAMQQLKKVFWQGTENWDSLLSKRAEMSGGLLFSENTQNLLKKLTQS